MLTSIGHAYITKYVFPLNYLGVYLLSVEACNKCQNLFIYLLHKESAPGSTTCNPQFGRDKGRTCATEGVAAGSGGATPTRVQRQVPSRGKGSMPPEIFQKQHLINVF